MKKFICLLLSAVIVLSFAVCTSANALQTASPAPQKESSAANVMYTSDETPVFPQYDEESLVLSELDGYVIVYPSYYNEYRMYEVNLLRDTIKNVLGFELEIISDAEPQREHEIILASSKHYNGVNDTLNLLQSGLDYVIGVVRGNIVLGGNNYYADMRAIYEFIGNYLGYDDLNNAYIGPAYAISCLEVRLYRKPPLTLLAANYSVSAFTEQYAIRDMHDAHFNLTLVETGYYTKQELHNFTKWCARYDIFIIFRGIRDTDIYLDCPVIWGHIIRDEPTTDTYMQYSEECDAYMLEYGRYGWKPLVNYFGSTRYWRFHSETEGFFDAVPVISFDRYFGKKILFTDDELLTVFESARDFSLRTGKDMWSYIESYNITNRNQNTSKMLRWSAYVSLSFGAKGILYFQYGDASVNYSAEGDWSKGSLVNWDFTKNQAWFDAKKTNEELLKLAPIYCNYKAVAANTINAKTEVVSAYLQDAYPYASDYITDFVNPQGSVDTYLFGFFEKNNGKGKAFTIVNLEDIDDIPYSQAEPKYAKIKINGKNITFYRDGEPQNIIPDADGYYNINLANGYCWFITTD